MEISFLKEALFAGMTSNAYKIGTVLTLGWFWIRVSGCVALYRGSSMETIDFESILSVAGPDVCSISPPAYIPHNNGETYFYVVRRANCCGKQEYTLAAAVKVSIGLDGELMPLVPNSVFGLKAEQIAGNRVRLIWYYCPLRQGQGPLRFKIYYDGGTGQIDYGNFVATISYAGRRFYQHQSEPLDMGVYLFAVRAEDAVGVENRSLAQIRIQLDATSPDAVDILSLEAV